MYINQKETPSRVLVTYAWVRSSWAMVRNLSQHGLEVHVGDHQRVFMSRFSRYSKKWFQYPHYLDDPEGFVDRVATYIEENNIGTYLPSHEEGFVVAKYRNKFPDIVNIPISTIELINQLDNKILAERLARSLGVSTPRTYDVSTKTSFENQINDLPKKGVIKISHSHGSHGVLFYHSNEGLSEQWHKLQQTKAPDDQLLVQEFIEGQIYTVTVLCEKGTVYANFSRKNIREKEVFGGTCVKAVSTYFPEGLSDVIKIVKHLGYTGVAMFEFLVNEGAGKYWLMEVNPRYWGTTSHDIDCGVEYPYMQYCLANNLEIPKMARYKEGVKSRWIAGDVISYFKHRKHYGPSYKMKNHFDLDDDYFMDFKMDDPLPFLVQSYLYFKHRKDIFK